MVGRMSNRDCESLSMPSLYNLLCSPGSSKYESIIIIKISLIFLGTRWR